MTQRKITLGQSTFKSLMRIMRIVNIKIGLSRAGQCKVSNSAYARKDSS